MPVVKAGAVRGGSARFLSNYRSNNHNSIRSSSSRVCGVLRETGTTATKLPFSFTGKFFCTSSSGSGADSVEEDALAWLSERGYTGTVAKGMLQAFREGNAPVSEVKTMGESGLKALAEAVGRELDAQAAQRKAATGSDSGDARDGAPAVVNVEIVVPAENDLLHLQAQEGDSIINLCNANPMTLKRYLVCACGQRGVLHVPCIRDGPGVLRPPGATRRV